MHVFKPALASFYQGVFVLCAISLAGFSYAQETEDTGGIGYTADEANATEAAKVPNLTINFSLNSVADPETTQYYTQIVEELLRGLPRKVSLAGDPASLVQTEPVYDHLKVVSYLPKPGTDPNGLSEKDIRYFTVEFEVPEGLVNLIELDELPPGVEGQSIVVHKGKYEDFVDILYNDAEEGAATNTPAVGLEKAGMDLNDIMGTTQQSSRKTDIGRMVDETAKADVARERAQRTGPTALELEISAYERSKKAGNSPKAEKVTPVKAVATPKTAAKPSLKAPLNFEGVTITYTKGVDVTGKVAPLAEVAKQSKRVQMIAFVSPTDSLSMTDVANKRFFAAENELRAAGVDVNSFMRSRIILRADGADKMNITFK